MSIASLTADRPGEKALLLGNEAIARGVLESGVSVVAAYPGTPSSEIVASLASAARESGQHVEWSVNEKVAFECASGAAFLGVRSFTAMKSVGLNVAMDPLMVVSLCGVKGGFVFVAADDPNCWSTQNEQDSRLLAQAAEIPCLEPVSPDQAKEMVLYGYGLSEKLGRPVMIRTVTRLNHSRAPVTLGSIRKISEKPRFHGLRAGFPALPKHRRLHEEKELLSQTLADCPFNVLSLKPGAQDAVIAAGNAANHAQEALGKLKLASRVSFLQVGVLNPLPVHLIKKILGSHERVFVFEEIEPFLEKEVRALVYEVDKGEVNKGVEVIGKLSGDLEVPGEFTTEKIMTLLGRKMGRPEEPKPPALSDPSRLVIEREKVLCAGCPHMGTFYALKKAKRKEKARLLVAGDIGCYGLGLYAPWELFDSHVCMGASTGVACGFAAAGYEGPVLCVLGDSTFYHSGMLGLINAVYNRHRVTVLVLDNAVIAMTGRQPDPGTGRTAMGEAAPRLDIAAIARACGVQHVAEVDPFQVEATYGAIREAMAFAGPSVVVAKGACAIMQVGSQSGNLSRLAIDEEKCDSCGVCASLLFCPALMKREKHFVIDQTLCAGCGLCAQVCPKSAIRAA